MKQFIKLLPLTMILLLVSCNTVDLTIEKEFFVKCLLNGEEWVNCCSDCGGGPWGSIKPIYSQYYIENGHLEIGAGNNCNLSNGFLIFSDSLNQLGRRALFPGCRYQDKLHASGCQELKLLESPGNFMQLTEILEKSVKGIFEASFTNDCGDTVRLKQGQFHVLNR